MSFVAVFSGILSGFEVTATVTLLGLVWAIPFAFVAGIAQHLTKGTLRLLVTAIIELWRSTPVLVLLYAFFYTLPGLGVRLSGVAVGSLVLGLNTGAYGSQAVRGALQVLGRGQVEAGKALGMGRVQILTSIELPQAFPIMLPTFVNQFIQLVKGTALVSLITLSDMTFRAKEIAQYDYAPVKIYSALLASYLIVCYPATIGGRWLERRVAPGRAQRSG